MKTSNRDKNQITLYYNSKNELGKKTYAAAKASKVDLLAINIADNKVSGTEWTKIADAMNMNILDLMDQNHNVFKGFYGKEKVDLSTKDALKLLEKNPEILVYPIAICGKKYVQIKNASEMRKLFSPDSKGTNLTKDI